MEYVPSYRIVESAKVGDEVGVITTYSDAKIVTVAKVLKQYIVLSDGTCFSKLHGQQVKGNKYLRHALITADAARARNAARVADQDLRLLRHQVESHQWRYASKALCEEVLAVVAKHTAAKAAAEQNSPQS